MTDEHSAALEARIAALEARLERWEAAHGAGAALTTPVVVTTPAGRAILEIQGGETRGAQLRLFNAAGRAVVSLGVDGTETGYLTLRNQTGELLACLDIEMAGARLQLLNHQAQAGVVVHGGDADGCGGGVSIIAETADIQLWADAAGGTLTITDAAGREVVALPPNRQGA